jgi:hypothetical protein
VKTITRTQAIADIRAKLLELVDDDHSVCEVATRYGIFCGGFAQWSFNELKKRYPFIVRSRPHITREELEDLANRWQLARQFVLDQPTACDVQEIDEGRHTCQGWNEFTEEELAGYHATLCGEQVQVVADGAPPAGGSAPQGDEPT